VKQKSARAAGRIEHVFHQRPVDAVFHRFGGEPVRRVIFAESMALAAVDKGFVEDLENIAFDFGEAEPPDMRHDAAHEFLAFRIGHGPIEKIAFDSAKNAGRPESFARKQMFWIVFPQAKNGERDALGNDDKECVLKRQRVALDLASINEFQELRPELPFQGDRRVPAKPAPQAGERRTSAAKGDRILAEFDANRQRIRRQRRLQRYYAVSHARNKSGFSGSRMISLLSLMSLPSSSPQAIHCRPSEAIPTNFSPSSFSRSAR
jgi:hypothetical protein